MERCSRRLGGFPVERSGFPVPFDADQISAALNKMAWVWPIRLDPSCPPCPQGIIPALEPSHAIFHGMQLAKSMRPDQHVLINCCGRGDKDMITVFIFSVQFSVVVSVVVLCKGKWKENIRVTGIKAKYHIASFKGSFTGFATHRGGWFVGRWRKPLDTPSISFLRARQVFVLFSHNFVFLAKKL
jgi:hypothetical protein